MIIKKVLLDDNDENVYLHAIIADKTLEYTRSAILIIPGGGYGRVCSDREGFPVANAFMPYGYNAFVLNYSTLSASKKTFPSQLIEASIAIKHIKDNAQEYGIDPDRVFVVGFSAGGHLAGSLGTMWDKKEIYDAIDMPFGYNKPKGVMLIYPVIYDHLGSFINLLGVENPSKDQLDKVRIDNNVKENSSPAFIVHGEADDLVPVQNSLSLAYAYADKKIPFELHVYPNAVHGMALANKITWNGLDVLLDPAFAKWVENAAAWAEGI